MKSRGLVLGVLLAAVAAYFIFFTKVADDKGGLEIMVDKYVESEGRPDRDQSRVARARVVLTFAAEGEGLPEIARRAPSRPARRRASDRRRLGAEDPLREALG